MPSQILERLCLKRKQENIRLRDTRESPVIKFLLRFHILQVLTEARARLCHQRSSAWPLMSSHWQEPRGCCSDPVRWKNQSPSSYCRARNSWPTLQLNMQWPGPTPDGIRCYLYLLVTSLASPKTHYQMTEEHDVLLHRNKKQPMIRKQKSKHCQYKCDYFRLIYPRCTGIKLVYSWWRVKQDRWRVNRNLANNAFVYCPQFRILLWICLTIFVLFHL